MKETEIEIEVVNGVEAITRKNIQLYLKIKGKKCGDTWFYRKYADNLSQIPSITKGFLYDYKHFLKLVEQIENQKANKVKKVKVKI
jgi:hypothetical protein